MDGITRKRKTDANSSDSSKRLKLTMASGASKAVRVTAAEDEPVTADDRPTDSEQDRGGTAETQPPQTDSRVPKKRRINKLVPPRPFPTVPTSVSATGPRSAHKEGKNFICLTRKTALGAYIRRCKDVILKDGYVPYFCSYYRHVYLHLSFPCRYKTLHFSALGAAIPLLLQLVVALPPILPFAADEIHTEVTTGTVEVQDEVIPDDEDEDVSYETRGKSSLKVIFKIGDGEFEGDKSGPAKKNGRLREHHDVARGSKPTRNKRQAKGRQSKSTDVVLQEPEQQEMEML